MLHKTLEAKRGNQISNGILYLILCELLDIPVRAIHIPKQFIIAYFKPGYSEENLPNPINKIEFFIDPTSGQVFTHHDVENYFKRISVPPVGSYFKPQQNKQVIQQLLEEFGKCFSGDKDMYKQTELMNLSKMLDIKFHNSNFHPSLYSLFTNWLASSKLVTFIFFASHNNFFRPRYLSSHPFSLGFFIIQLRMARLPINILSVNGPAYSNGELVCAFPYPAIQAFTHCR